LRDIYALQTSHLTPHTSNLTPQTSNPIPHRSYLKPPTLFHFIATFSNLVSFTWKKKIRRLVLRHNKKI
jgi:hypothetical protein